MNYIQHQGTFIPISYTPSETDAMFANIPVSQFGDLTANPIPVTIAGSVVTVGPTPIFMNGKSYQLAATNIDLTTMDASSRMWVFLQIDNSGNLGFATTFTYNDTAHAESPTNMLVGTVTTDASKTLTVSINKVTRVGNFRLSASKIGSAIPVSTGSPYDSGTFNW